MTTVERLQYIISVTLKIFIGFLAILSFIRSDYFFVFASLFVLFLTFLPAIISRSYRITLPPEIDFVLTFILYLHYGLGEYVGLYTKVSWWDLFLHSGNSIILGFVGFAFAYALLITSRIKAKPFFVSIFALTFTVFVGVIWEVFEFSMDQLFGFNMQKSGIVDTMTDLMADTLGGLLVAILGFLYIKNPRPGIIHQLVTRFASSNTYRRWHRWKTHR